MGEERVRGGAVSAEAGPDLDLEGDLRHLSRLLTHELRSPAGVLRGYLAMLAEGSLGELPDQARDAVEVAYQQSVRLCTLLEHVLLALHLREGSVTVRLAHLDLAAWLRERLAEAGAWTVEFDAEITSLAASFDPQLLAQALTNLLENARNASPPGAAIRVRLRRQEQTAIVEVIDRGSGLPRGFVPGLFKHAAGSCAPDHGLGLGLFIAERIARLHNGRLTYRSSMAGTEVFLQLPADP